jgi:hypothetical protein
MKVPNGAGFNSVATSWRYRAAFDVACWHFTTCCIAARLRSQTILKAVVVVQPETLVRWHRVGFRCYWRWKSRSQGGRPQIDGELRALIRRMSIENPLWGAPRIHGELLKLGFEVAQSSVAKYMARRRRPPSQGWGTFLRNHAPEIAAMDLFVVPTLGFNLLYGWSLSDWTAEILSGSTSQPIQRQNGLPARSQRRFRGIRHRVTWSVIGTALGGEISFRRRCAYHACFVAERGD